MFWGRVMAAASSSETATSLSWRRLADSAWGVLFVSPDKATGLAARLMFSAVVFAATVPYSAWLAPGLWLATMVALAVAEHRRGQASGDNLFAWLQSAGYGLAGFYLTFFQFGAAQTFGVTLYGVVMFEILARDYARPKRLITNLTPMLVSMALVQATACFFLLQRQHPWRIITVLATSYLVFRAFRSVQIDLFRAHSELAEASLRAQADARRIRETHRIALMAETMAGVGHWRLDRASGVTTWSEGVYRIYGLDPSTEALGFEAQAAHYAVEDRERLGARLQAAAATGEAFEVEARLMRADGAVRQVLCHGGAELGPNGVVTTLFGVFMDVTDARAREEALLDAKLRAEAAAEAKAEFLANMSHEIRTPLTAINGFSNLLGALTDLPPAAGVHVRRIHAAGLTLLTVVNDILDFSKLEAGQVALYPRPFAVAPFFDDAIALFAEQARAAGLALSVDIAPGVPDTLHADADRLRQIVVNLVGNAIKFTDAGEVQVAIGYQTASESLSVTVSDTGCGVPVDKRERLFQRFSQVDGGINRRHGGTGLGLSICKGLAEMMGGTIDMAPSASGGSTFRFHIAAPATELPAHPKAVLDTRRPADGGAARVLVVDDLDVNRELVRAMLQAVGHQVWEAGGGAEALDVAARQPFDIILMDLQMPGMDGFAAARAIRERAEVNRDTPIIALSADVLPEHIGATAEAGMNGHIGKPISALELVSTIDRWSMVRLSDVPAALSA